jgi:hypothetical protein
MFTKEIPRGLGILPQGIMLAFGAKPAADLYFQFALRPSNESGAATFHA